MPARRVPLSAALVVPALLVSAAIVLSWQGLALAGDGSFYLVRILGDNEVFSSDSRMLANIVRQTPVLLVARAGVTDTHVLTIVHGFGQLVLPAIVWSIAILLARADRVAFCAVALTAGLCALATWFFSVSENVLAVSLLALVAVLLWLPRWGWRHVAVAAGGSFVLVSSYETAVVTGVLFFAWAVSRSRLGTRRPDRLGSIVVAALSLLAIVTSVLGVRAGPSPGSSQSLLYFVVSLEPRGFYVALAGVIVLVVAAATLSAGLGRTAAVVVGLLLLAAGVHGLEPSSVRAFEARGGASIAVFLLAAFLFWQWRVVGRTPDASAELPARFVLIPVAFAAVVVGLVVSASTTWAESLDAFRREVDRGPRVVEADSVLPATKRRVLWGWTAASLSLVVRSDATDGILVDRNPNYVPFASRDARQQLDDSYVWKG